MRWRADASRSPDSPSNAGSARSVVVRYYLLACGISWAVWAPLAALALGWTTAEAPRYLHLIGGLGPALAAVVVAGSCGDGATRRLLARVSRVDRWVAVAIAGPVVLYLGAALGVTLAGGTIQLALTGTSTEFPGLGLVGGALANILCYGLGEEIGWRGFVLPRLQRTMSATRASLVIAALWAAWHLPLLAFSGMAAMGPAAALGWLASMFAGSFLMTFLFNASRGNVLAVAVFHGTLDVLMNSPVGSSLQSAMGALVTVAGLTLPFAFGRANLAPVARTAE